MLNPPPRLLLLPSFFTPTPRFLISAGITNSWKQICYKSAFTISNAALFIIAITPEVHQLSLYLFPHVVSRNFVDNLHAVLVFLHLTQRKNLENKRQTVGNSKIKRGKERKTRVVSLSEFYSAVIFSTLSLSRFNNHSSTDLQVQKTSFIPVAQLFTTLAQPPLPGP